MTRDEWQLLGYGILTAALMGLVLSPILLHNRHFPRSIAEIILGAIALSVFAIYRFTGRKKSN